MNLFYKHVLNGLLNGETVSFGEVYTVIFSYEVLIIYRKMEKYETLNQKPTKNV